MSAEQINASASVDTKINQMIADQVRTGPLTYAQKLQFKRLYLYKKLPVKEIAVKFGMADQTAYNWVTKLGLKKLRDEMERKAESKAIETEVEQAKEFVESLALRSQLAVDKGFDLIDESKSALEFSAAASGVAKLVPIARQALSIDNQSASNTPAINLIFGNPAQFQPQNEVNVTNSESLDVDSKEVS